MIVVDASVLTNAFTDDGPVGAQGRAELGLDLQWAAPKHLIAEVFLAIRGRRLAVAETFDCPFVTADTRLSRLPNLRCEVRLALPALPL